MLRWISDPIKNLISFLDLTHAAVKLNATKLKLCFSIPSFPVYYSKNDLRSVFDILHLIIKYLYNILKRISVVCIEIILFMIVLMRFAHSASCSSFVPVAFYMPIEE